MTLRYDETLLRLNRTVSVVSHFRLWRLGPVQSHGNMLRARAIALRSYASATAAELRRQAQSLEQGGETRIVLEPRPQPRIAAHPRQPGVRRLVSEPFERLIELTELRV